MGKKIDGKISRIGKTRDAAIESSQFQSNLDDKYKRPLIKKSDKDPKQTKFIFTWASHKFEDLDCKQDLLYKIPKGVLQTHKHSRDCILFHADNSQTPLDSENQSSGLNNNLKHENLICSFYPFYEVQFHIDIPLSY